MMPLRVLYIDSCVSASTSFDLSVSEYIATIERRNMSRAPGSAGL